MRAAVDTRAMRTHLAAACLLAAAWVPARAGTPAPGFTDEAYVTGLANPTAIAFLPDGRLLITEKGGFGGAANAALKLFDGTSTTTLVTLPVCTDSEMGLLGVAVDPAFATNGFIYLYRSAPGTGGCGTATGRFNQVVRVTMAGGTVNPGSLTVLLDGIRTDDGNHDGGVLRIGPDGKLYVGVGDTGLGDNRGGPGSSTNPYAQDLSSLNGKILRLALDGSVPPDNPFVGTAGARGEIFAYGFRNPWRFGFDPQTDKLWAGDVGDATWEEIDIVVAGGDYGWPACEGLAPTGCNPHTDSLHFVDPILVYPHGGTGLEGEAVIGGAFAPETGPFADADLGGDYFFADLGEPGMPSEGTLWHAVPTLARDGIAVTPEMIVSAAANPVDVIFGPDGALYYVAITSGEVRRVTPASSGTTTTTTTTATTTTTTTTTRPPTITTTTTSSTTTTTTSSTTTSSTTTLPACTDVRAPDDPTAARCLIGLLQGALADPIPACPRRCRCNFGPKLDALSRLLDQAAAGGPRRCRRRLAAAASAADRLRRRVTALAAHGCANASLTNTAALLGNRLRALRASGYCAAG
jgi:glucose/arabinose dehydrogenase